MKIYIMDVTERMRKTCRKCGKKPQGSRVILTLDELAEVYCTEEELMEAVKEALIKAREQYQAGAPPAAGV